MVRKRSIVGLALAAGLAAALLVGCSSGAAPAPTAKPAEAPKTAAEAPKPTAAAAQPAATQAPAAVPAKSSLEGKTVNLIVPNSAGGGIDTVARYTAPYVKKHSGAKEVVVQNVVGAAAIKGMNELWIAKPDGLTIGFGSVVTMALQQLSGQEGVKFDAAKFNYLGRSYYEPRIVIAPTKGNIKTIQDVIAKKKLTLPIQGLDDDFLSFSVVAKQLGVEIKALTGFAAQAEVFLAAMRGEGDLASTGLRTADPMIKQGDMKPILVVGPKRVDLYPDVPTASEVVTSAEGKATLQAISNLVELQMSYVAPPGMDQKLVDELRGYVTKALTDDEAVSNAKAKAGGREVLFLKGEELQKGVQQVTTDAQKIVPILKEAVASVK